MALQVSNYTVVDNSRNLTNITGADAATISALNSAGVGASSTNWTELPNKYSTSVTITSSTDTGLINASTVLSGMPNDFKYFLLYFKIKSNLTSSSNGYFYVTPNNLCEIRLGNSSSSYFQDQTFRAVLGYTILYGTGHSNASQAGQNSVYAVLLFDKTLPSTLPHRNTVLDSATTGNCILYQGNDGLELVKENLLPPIGSYVTGGGDWNTSEIKNMGVTNDSQSITIDSDLNYLAFRYGGGYSQGNYPGTPSATITVAGAYIA